MKNKKSAEKPERRSFLKKSAIAAGAIAAPIFIPASALGRAGRPAPSERVTIAGIGLGGMGMINSGNFLGIGDCQIVAVCDVDEAHVNEAQKVIQRDYRNRFPDWKYNSVDAYRDFREVLDRDDIDAVYIVTPDHWHEQIGIAAAQAGKDIYGEKPMTHTIKGGRRLVNAVNKYGRIFQMGTMTRSHAPVRRALERVRNGRIGKVHTVKIGIPAGNTLTDYKEEKVPEGFDYDFWLGPAPWKPYTPKRCHFWFRWIMDYSDGPITDLGTHYLDVAQWGTGHDLIGPKEIVGHASWPESGLFDAAMHGDFKMTFEDGIVYDCSTRYKLGLTFEGDEGWIFIPMRHPLPLDPITASDPRILRSEIGSNEIHLNRSENHWATFINCVKTRNPNTAINHEVGHRSTTLPHLGNIAWKVPGKKLQWDYKTDRFLNSSEANSLLDTARRAPWNLYS